MILTSATAVSGLTTRTPELRRPAKMAFWTASCRSPGTCETFWKLTARLEGAPARARTSCTRLFAATVTEVCAASCPRAAHSETSRIIAYKDSVAGFFSMCRGWAKYSILFWNLDSEPGEEERSLSPRGSSGWKGSICLAPEKQTAFKSIGFPRYARDKENTSAGTGLPRRRQVPFGFPAETRVSACGVPQCTRDAECLDASPRSGSL